jgi:hypothetical protein
MHGKGVGVPDLAKPTDEIFCREVYGIVYGFIMFYGVGHEDLLIKEMIDLSSALPKLY